MTEPGSVLLDRAQIERAFTALGDRLVQRGVVADVFIVGGAAMALAYDATRVTRDVDSLFVPHGVVLEEARNVAQDLGLPAWWLNEQASVYISGKDDPDKRRVFDHPGLRVTAASSRHIFAMKGPRRQDPGHRRSPPARRHHRRRLRGNRSADLRGVLSRRRGSTPGCRRPPGTL